jgi:hypothetical protein
MTQAVQQLLANFEQLSKEEQHVAAIEVLRRSAPNDKRDAADEELVELAEALFIDLDRQEDDDVQA